VASDSASEQPAKPVKIDWEAIERDYRAGMLSIREIAKAQGVSDTAIRKKATASGWERDLSAKVAEKVRNELVRAEFAAANLQTEREIVETAAATIVQVVRGHRTRITRQTELVDLLTEQITSAAGKREEIESAIWDETALDKDGKRRSAMMRAVALPTHASTVVNLTNALKTLIGLERQAFSIRDDSEAPPNALGDLLKQVGNTGLAIVQDSADE